MFASKVASRVQASSPRLLADIGGTHARFGWQAPEGGLIEHARLLPAAERADWRTTADLSFDNLHSSYIPTAT